VPRWSIALTLLALALGLAACGGDDSSEKKTASTTTGQKNRPPNEAADARREARDEKEQQNELKKEKQSDEDFNRSFSESSFERLVGKLPIRKPPLFVEQYITGEGHKLYTAVERQRFCKLQPAKREAAVTAFFKSADKSFRAAGVKDFAQVVTPLADSIENLPALATASAGKVALTARGRAC
jgi:hypothetical protein